MRSPASLQEGPAFILLDKQVYAAVRWNHLVLFSLLDSTSSLARAQGGTKEVCALVALDTTFLNKERLIHNVLSKLYLLLMRCFVQDTYFVNDHTYFTNDQIPMICNAGL